MFKFSFGPPDGARPAQDATSTPDDALPAARPLSVELPLPAARIVTIQHRIDVNGREWDAVHLSDDFILRKSTACVPNDLTNSGSDLVSGVYEGGYKVWECALDLVAHLRQQPTLTTGANVLEIGAGHALPAIAALRLGATSATLHDYNEAVLRDCTAPNAAANAVDMKPLTYVAGHWGALHNVVPDAAFQLVLTADTAYNVANILTLVHAVWRALAPGGTALLAAKTYYFGVGGGTAALRHALQQLAPNVAITTVPLRDGRSNVREILRVQKPQ